jgi:hypothetical protein
MQQGIHGYSHLSFLRLITNRHIKNLYGATGTMQSKATGEIMHGIEIEIANLRVLTICPDFPRHGCYF